MQYPSVLFANCNIHLHYFLHKVNMLTPSCHKWPAHTVIWIWFVFNDAWVHFLSEIDKIWYEAVSTVTCSRNRFHHLSGLRTLLLIHNLTGSSIRFTIHFHSGLKRQFTIHLCRCLKHYFFLITGISHVIKSLLILQLSQALVFPNH